MFKTEETVVKKLIYLPYIHLYALASFLLLLGFWVIFGYIRWEEINQANLVGLYVFGAIFLILAPTAMILAMKKMKLYPFDGRPIPLLAAIFLIIPLLLLIIVYYYLSQTIISRLILTP